MAIRKLLFRCDLVSQEGRVGRYVGKLGIYSGEYGSKHVPLEPTGVLESYIVDTFT